MSFQVGIGFLSGTVFFQLGLLWTMLLLARTVLAELGILAVAWDPTTWCAWLPHVYGPLRTALHRPPLVQITSWFVEVKLSSAIVASDPLKLSYI